MTPSIRAALAALLLAAPLLPWDAQLAGQEHELSMGSVVRFTGATVLRGGPASPPRLFPTVMEGNVVGMRGDTILFETGNEPVYWIPLGAGPLLVERRAAVTDMKRSIAVATFVGGAAGATFALGIHDQCQANEEGLALGVVVSNCAEDENAGGTVLRGVAIGAGIGAVAGVVLGRFVKRQGWVAMPPDQIRFRALPGPGLAMRVPVGGRPTTPRS